MVEAKLDKGRGPLATVLVQRGTLRVGDVFVVGADVGQGPRDDRRPGPPGEGSRPVLPGRSARPRRACRRPAITLTVVENEARAREVADLSPGACSTSKRTTSAPVSLENMFASRASTTIEFPLVVKADVQGSVEAIVNALNKISTDEIKVRVLHSGVGAITESDVTLAAATGAPIIGFNVRPNAKAREVADRNKVEMRYYDVIYHLTDWVKGAMAGELGPGDHRDGRRPRRGQGSLPRRQAGQGRRPAGPRRRHPQGPPRAPHARGRHRRRRPPSPRSAASRTTSTEVSAGHGVRRAAGRHQRHQAGRQPRSVRGRGARTDAVTVTLNSFQGPSWRPHCEWRNRMLKLVQHDDAG